MGQCNFLHLWHQKLYRAFRFGTLCPISCSYPRHSQLTRHSLMLANGRMRQSLTALVSYMCPLLDNYGFQLIISIVYITCEYLLEETFLKPKSSMDFNVNTKFSWGINAPLGKCRAYEVADPKHDPLLFCSRLMTIALVIACELAAVFIANKSYEPLCEYIHLTRKCAFVTVVYASVWSGNSVNNKNIGC